MNRSSSLISSYLTSISVFSLISVSCVGGLSCRAETSDAPLTGLASALADGPIKIEQASGVCVSARKDAISMAFAAVNNQIVQEPIVWEIYFSDTEFMGAPIVHRPCWLVAIPKGISAPLPEGPARIIDVFAVIDGKSGCFIEAFSQPESSWWKLAQSVGPSFQKQYSSRGETGLMSSTAPSITLSTALGNANTGFLQTDFGLAKQIVARYLLYTNAGQGIEVSRVDGSSSVLLSRNIPIWYVSLQGLNKPYDGSVPPGVSPANLPRFQEDYVMIDARTGKLGSYGEDR